MKSIDHERLESVLLDAILSGGSLQELFDRVYECIALPLVCFDTTFHMLAYAFPRPFYYSHWEDMAERGSAAESAIIGYNYLESQEKMYEHGRSLCFDTGTCEGYPQACGPVMAGGRLAAYCGIMIEDCRREDALRANDLIARAAARLILDRSRDGRGGAVERLLIRNEYGPETLAALSGALHQPPYAFVIVSAEGRGVSTLEYLRGRLCQGGSGAVGCLAGEERLYILQSGLSAGERGRALERLESVARLCEVRAGTSDIFDSLEETSERRAQALLALSAGGGGPVSTFSGSYAAIVGRCALGRYGAAASRSSPLEALAGLDGEYLQTLRLYLQLFRRPAAVAEAQGLHRNTVINRIRKVEELLHADLSDAETASALQLGLELAELSDAERRGANG